MVCMKQQIFGVLLPFMSFMHTFDRKRDHNMLALMFDPRLITICLGHQNVVANVVKYD